MHNISDPKNFIDKELAESPMLLGKECLTCRRALRYFNFRSDSSNRDGRRDRCIDCEDTPALSTSEHIDRLNELNFSSEAVKKQRWSHQGEYMNDEARMGHWMDGNEFLRRLNWISKDLITVPGNFKGDLSMYKIYGRPQPDLDNKTYKYLMYIPIDYTMPEASLIEFDNMLIPVREKKRGWRTPLLRLIKSKTITEQDCEWAFGKPTPGADSVWNRELYQWRNGIKI